MRPTLMKSLITFLSAILLSSGISFSQSQNSIEEDGGKENSHMRYRDSISIRNHHQRGDRNKNRRGPREKRADQIDSVKLAPFKAMEMPTNGTTVKYRAAVVSGSSDNSPALVVYLHGKHGSGNDNIRQMDNQGIYAIYDYFADNKISAIVLVPQCSEEYNWSGRRGRQKGIGSTGYNKYVKELIDKCVLSMGIDTTRIYVLGPSMGGGGVWNMLDCYPGFFAGALSASGSSTGCKIENLAQTPVISTLGTEETQATVESFQKTVNDINAKGGNAKFEALEGLTHPQACAAAFSPDRLKWVFSNQKGTIK